MSCCCNSSPCMCVPACLSDCPEVIEYDAENINLAGIGTFEAEVDNVFQFRGVRSTNGNLTVALNNTFHTIDLTLSNLTIVGTKTFSNAANRALTTPDFEGQIGVQLDTDVIYYATGVAVGNWASDFTFLSGKTTTMANATTIQVANAATVTVTSPTNNSAWEFDNMDVNFDNCDIVVQSDCSFQIDSDISFNGVAFINSTLSLVAGASVIFDGASIFDISTLTSFRIDSAAVPANSVIVTAGASSISSRLLNTFLSTANTSAYGAPTGTLLRTALAAYAGQNVSVGYVEAEAQATDDAVKAVSQTLAALITDLKATLKPT